jgi:phenylacetic acid degradation operon negative regulatory protein
VAGQEDAGGEAERFVAGSRGGSVVSAGSARSLLLTVLGELVYPNAEPVWTSSLLYVLTGLGFEEQTARQAVARGAASGWIEAERQGREVRWSLAPAGRKLIEDGMRRVYSLHTDDGPWDGNWLMLLVTIPQTRRAVRKKLYSALSWSGFGNPTPGLWLSPHPDRLAEAERVVADLELQDSTLSFVGRATAVGLDQAEIVARAWDLDEVAGRYEDLLVRFAGAEPRGGDEVLFSHLELVSEWQRFPFMDPQLPEELLPNWIGRRAARLFHQQRSSWYERAQARWREVVAETSPGA